jgi:hypothetical protein
MFKVLIHMANAAVISCLARKTVQIPAATLPLAEFARFYSEFTRCAQFGPHVGSLVESWVIPCTAHARQ